ncbi:MAG: glycosyltransferase family 4 protein [Candidatus Moranbacteria bacterium]|nr:glycosyltransferase family 4 protein [Candidatus Moranbacteria bacterium]
MKKGKMKILFITRTRTARGGHIVFTNLVRELHKEGYDVTLTTFESKEKMKRVVPYWENIDVNFVEIPHLEDRDSEQMAHIEAASVYIRENIDKFDKIILDSWFIAMAALRENIFSDKIFHLVQSNSAFAPENKGEFWKSELFNLLPFTPMNRIIVSESLALHFKEKYRKDFKTMHLFLDEVYLKNEFNVKSREILKIVSSSATFNLATKGLNFLLEQLEKVKELKFELTLVSGDVIKKDLSVYSFPIKVVGAKNPTEMVEELGKHDVYVNTSTKESFCLALAEAMAIGMPVVALDSVGNREYMDGENAIFVEKEEDFIPGLLKMKDIEFRNKISVKAKESMRRYTLKNSVKSLKEIVGI